MGPMKFKMHEQDASEILQFTSLRHISTANWCSFVGKRLVGGDMITVCDEEYKIKWTNIKSRKLNKVPRPKLCSFDIEVNSTNPSAMPKATNPGDRVFQISCVLSVQGQEKTDDHILTLGDPDPEIVGKNTTIHKFDTESELLVGFTGFLKEHKVNIIMGYNILNFDIPYMIERAKTELCFYEFDRQGFLKYGHAKEKTIKWSSSAYGDQTFQYLDAEGVLFVDLLPLVKRDYKMANYKLKTIATHFLGQTKDPLDVKGIFKCYREGIKNKNGVYSTKARQAMGICAKYCVVDSVLVSKLFEKLQTWIGLCEMAAVCHVPIFYLYTQGQQIKVYSQIYRHCLDKNIVVEKDGYIPKEGEHYQGAKVFDPIPGMYEKVVPLDFSSLYPSTMIAYNIDYSTLVGKNDKSIPNRKCHIMEWSDHVNCSHDQKVIRKLQLDKVISKDKEVIKKIRDKKNKTLDKFRKKELLEKINKLTLELKPYIKERSAITKKKNKHTMCAKRRFKWVKESVYKGVMPTVLQNLLDARKKTRAEAKVLQKILKGKKITEDEEKLIEPKYVKLIGKKLTKTDIKIINSLCEVLDKRQLAYKVSANSMYGAMGVQRGYLPFMPGAMATTYMGRKNIEITADKVVNEYRGELVYGDTDSVMVYFKHLSKADEIWDYAIYVAKQISDFFPGSLVLEFEDIIYWKFLILTKKRYMTLTCLRDGIVSSKIKNKGVLLARRDNSKFVRDLYETVVMMCFDNKDRNEVIYYITTQLNKLCSDSFEHSNFIITKAIGDSGDLKVEKYYDEEKGIEKGKCGSYIVPLLSTEEIERTRQFKLKNCTKVRDYYLRCLPAQVQLAEKMRSRGQRVDVGTRLEYVITKQAKHTSKQYERIESADYFNNHSSVIKLDFMYYLDNLSNPMDELLNIRFDKDVENNKYAHKYETDFIHNQYKYRLKIRTKMLNELKTIFTPKISFEE